MKYLAQISALAVSILLLSTSTNASPVTNLEVREPIPETALAPVLIIDDQVSAPAELEKRRFGHHPHSSSNNNSDTNDAASLASDGTLRLAGVAFLSSAMLLMTSLLLFVTFV